MICLNMLGMTPNVVEMNYLLMWIRIVMKTWGQSVYVVTFALNYVTVVFVRVS